MITLIRLSSVTIQSYKILFSCNEESESESCSVIFDSLRPHGLSMKFSRLEYWSG